MDRKQPIILAILVPILLAPVLVKGQVPSLLPTADTSYFRKGETDWNLVESAIRGNPANIFLLLKRGADPNARARGGMTALMFASENGDSLSARILLLNGADPDLTFVEETTPLMVAVLNQHFGVAHMLLQFGADPGKKDIYGVPSVVYAAALNNYQLSDLLLYFGAERESRDSAGNTALMTAAGLGFLETSDILLQNGCDPDARDTLMNTPLMVAAQHGDTALISLLLEYGAELESVNKQNYTPLALAVSAGEYPAARLLADSGANVSHNISTKLNIADLALRSGQKELRKIMDDRGAKPTAYPDFSEFQVAWGNSFGKGEHMMQARLRLQDMKYSFFIETGYDVRPILRTVQLRENDTLIYQYRESMSVLALGVGKNFRLATDQNLISYGLYASLYGMLAFPRHRGIWPHPPPAFRLAPAAGIFMEGRMAGIRAGTERYSFGTLNEGKWKINITLYFRILFNNSRIVYKTMPY